MGLIKIVTSGIIIFFSSVGLVTKFEYQDIKYDKEYLKKTPYGNRQKVLVGLHMYPTKKNKRCVIPLIYTHDQNTGPYEYSVSIYGPLDEIKPKKGYFLINQQKKEISVNRNRWERTESKQIKGRVWFAIIDTIDLDWESLDNFRFIIEFIGIKDGKETHYKKELVFEKEHNEWKGNYIFDAIMSV